MALGARQMFPTKIQFISHHWEIPVLAEGLVGCCPAPGGWRQTSVTLASKSHAVQSHCDLSVLVSGSSCDTNSFNRSIPEHEPSVL